MWGQSSATRAASTSLLTDCRALDLAQPLSRISDMIGRAEALARDLKAQSVAADQHLAEIYRALAAVYGDTVGD